jgi:protein-disulfide isomerase
MEPLDDAVDHVRGGWAGRLVVEYGDYECPYSRRAFREIEHVERELGEGVRFAFRHFPLTEIHPHALDVARFDGDRTGAAVLARVRRDVQSGVATGEVRGTPTLFIDGVVHRGGYDAATLLEALAR